MDIIAEGDNKYRFAAAAVMYSWLGASDRQFIYGKAGSHKVYSVDHGHFFQNGPNWTIASLSAAPPPQRIPTS
jgi:hypothetical protein